MTPIEHSASAPRPGAHQIRSRIEEELSGGSRAGYTLLLLIDLLVGVVIASLWMTEPQLPTRTHVAFGLMLAISIAWAAFFFRVLSRRGPFLVTHRLAGAKIAVAVTSIFTAASLLLAVVDGEIRGPALASSVLGSLLFGVAIVLFVRAKRRLSLLQQRRDSLQTRTKGVGTTALLALFLLMLQAGSLDAQQLTPNPFELVVTHPPASVRALGREHLVYELHMTNFGVDSQHLERLVALDENGDRVIGDWAAADLAARIMIVGDPGAKRTMLNAGERAVIHTWITLSPDAGDTPAIRHRLVTRREGDDRSDEIESEPVSIIRSVPKLGVPPVGSGRWASLRGPSNASGHRRSLVPLDGRVRVPQRFAVDWAALGDDGRLFRGTGSANRDWYGYSQPVVAAITGRIVRVVDGIAESDPMTAKSAAPFSRETVAGNLVVIDSGEGVFATYAHLRPGSILVKRGEVVSAGDILGEIGNSGHSLAPHLHFHLSDTADPLAAEGLPFEIRQFHLLGKIDNVPLLLGGGAWETSPDRPSRRVANEIPLENMIVEFR